MALGGLMQTRLFVGKPNITSPKEEVQKTKGLQADKEELEIWDLTLSTCKLVIFIGKESLSSPLPRLESF